MKSKIAKTLGIVALTGYTAIVGTIGLQVGKLQERAIHKEDGLVLTVKGDQSFQKLDITARFGNDQLQLNDLGNYARVLAQEYPLRTLEDVEGEIRYNLVHRDNMDDVFPRKFKVVGLKSDIRETQTKIFPGVDTEFKYGLY